MYLRHNEEESTQVLNGLPCIIPEELIINTKHFITRSGIKIATMGIWDREKSNFANTDELHNEQATEGMFEGTGITELDLDQETQAALRNKMEDFDEADLQKPYAQA